MKIGNVYQLAKLFFPGLRAKSFPSVIKNLFSFLGYFALFIGFIITTIFQLLIEEKIIISNLGQEKYLALTEIGLGLLMIGGGLVLANILGKSFFRSYYFKGTEQRMPDMPKNSSQVSFEVAEIFFNFNQDLMTSFFESSYGKEIVIRTELGAEFFEYATKNIHSQDKELVFPEKIKIDLFVLADILVTQVPELEQALFNFGRTKEEFLASANWVNEIIQRRKDRIRSWDKKGLSKISGLGKDLSYGYTKLLEKFTNSINEYPDFRHFDKENIKVKDETEQLIAILAKDKESNAMLVSDTAGSQFEILFKLGHEIADGTVTPELESKRILVLDGTLMVAAAGEKQQFESLFLQVFNEASSAGNIILVIDKLPAFIETAHAIGSDVVSLLDPYISSNRLQLIALTSVSLYYQILERNPAIVERFGTIQIQDSSIEKTLKIIQEMSEYQEKRHGVYITYPAIKEMVESADRYIVQGLMPDKAIDILLEIVPYTKEIGKKFVTKEIVQTVITNKTGVKLGKITEQETEKLLSLEKLLHGRVVGQDEAVKRIANTIRRSRSGIQNPQRPLGSFLFLGPTGVGKTEISKALAEVFFGNENTMSRFDMSEYTTIDSVEKLIGSFETGQIGTLVSALKKNPYGLILLDEFEKSSPSVKDLFLQILDEGVFSDMQGKKINARNTIIIATSNAGAGIIWDLFEKKQDLNSHRDELIDSIVQDQVFKPELLNRFDDIVVFHPLDKEKREQIVILMLRKLQKRIYEQKRIKISFDQEVISKVSSEGINQQFGARPMNRYIQDHIERSLANKIVSGQLKAGDSINIVASDLE